METLLRASDCSERDLSCILMSRPHTLSLLLATHVCSTNPNTSQEMQQISEEEKVGRAHISIFAPYCMFMLRPIVDSLSLVWLNPNSSQQAGKNIKERNKSLSTYFNIFAPLSMLLSAGQSTFLDRTLLCQVKTMHKIQTHTKQAIQSSQTVL